MREFFSVYHGPSYRFPAFSPLHAVILVTIGVIILSMICFRKKLCQRGNIYRYLIAIIALVIELSYLIWLIKVGKWHFKTSLPLELCEVTLFLCVVMLITKSHLLFEVAYFWGFTGSTLALIFPSLHVPGNRFTFWAFMLTHSLVLFSLALIMIIEKYQPALKSIWVSLVALNIYLLSIVSVNYFFGTNYFFYYVFGKPASGIPNPLAIARSPFVKLLLLEGSALVAFLICYLPFLAAKVFKKD